MILELQSSDTLAEGNMKFLCKRHSLKPNKFKPRYNKPRNGMIQKFTITEVSLHLFFFKYTILKYTDHLKSSMGLNEGLSHIGFVITGLRCISARCKRRTCLWHISSIAKWYKIKHQILKPSIIANG